MKSEVCHCGKPLHYADPKKAAIMRKMVLDNGAFIPVVACGRTWKVQRHYIALHGIKAKELPYLGFLEVDP